MIEFDDVAHDYGGGALFEGVTVALEPGSFHFLTGPSGAGKSTFLKLCYGELLPSRGTVTLQGDSLRSLSRDALAEMRTAIGVVHQDCQFLDHLDIRSECRAAAQRHRAPCGARCRRLAELGRSPNAG